MKIPAIKYTSDKLEFSPPKFTTVYLSEKRNKIIVAPYFQDGENGICYEQLECESLNFNIPNMELGIAINTSLNKFEIKKRNLESREKSDWPAFLASGEKSMRSFEEKFERITIRGVNEGNITFRIETARNQSNEIELVTYASVGDKERIGAKIKQLYNSDILNK